MARLSAATPVTLISGQLQGSVYDLEITALNADRYVIGYGHTSAVSGQDPADHRDLQFEIRGFDGSIIAAPRRLTTAEGGNQHTMSISEGPDGVFAVGWHAQNLTPGNVYVPNFPLADTVRLAVFNPDGTVRTPEAAYEPGGTLQNWNGVAVGWTALAGEAIPLIAGSAYGTIQNPNSTDMMLLVPGYPTQIAYGGERAGSQGRYQIVTRPDGDMTLAWADSNGGVHSIRGGILDLPGPAGTFSAEWFVPLTGALPLTANTGDLHYEVIVLASGQTVVSYSDDFKQKFRVFEADGSGGGTPIIFAPDDDEVALASAVQQPASAVAALPGGGFVAIWAQGGYTNAEGVFRPTGFWTRTYDAAGNATGDGLMIRAFPGAMEVFDVDIDVSDDGSIVAGWRIRDANTLEAFTETIVLAEVVEVRGTTGNNTLAATHRAEDFIGLAGTDTVSYLAATAGVSAALAPGLQQTGDAAEDRYDSIENLTGSRHGDDLRGDDLANLLTGLEGDDTLSGNEGNDTLQGGAGADSLIGGAGSNVLVGDTGADTLQGGDGTDTLNGGDNDDFLYGGLGAADLRDVAFGGAGRDHIDGGAGNDSLSGGLGEDTILGGLGSDTLIGNEDADLLTGGGGSDLMFGNVGNDTLNGGFGFDRMNGGADADTFFHLGIADHGSDWVQDYSAAEGDVLQVGLAGAVRSQFQINTTFTPGAGAAGVAEAFVIYRPTGQILWALVDGGDDAAINVNIGGQVFNLLG